MKKLVIYTDGYSHNCYTVNLENGNITYGQFKESGRWKFRGFRHVKQSSRFISLKEIQENNKVLDVMTWQYLNGRGQWRVCDLDCGTHREWGERVLGCYFTE